MTASDLLSSLEVALGGICSPPRVLSASRLLELSVNSATIEKLLKHWDALPAGSRPRLRGLTVTRDVPASRQFLLEVGGRAPFLLVTVESGWAGRSVAGIWPYAAWWESELSDFEKVSFPEGRESVEVAWRRF